MPNDATASDTERGVAPRDLADLARGFFQAREFAVETPQPGLILGRLAGGEPSAVLAPQADGAETADPARIDALLAAARAAGATGLTPVAVTSRKGIGPADLKRFNEAGAQVLYPLQFLDWYFRSRQGGGEGAGIDKRLRDAIDLDLIRARAPQPFRALRTLDAAGGADDDRDLFAVLEAQMARFPESARLRVISGAAGVGKTVLVTALLKARQDDFNAAKSRANALASRPLLFEPVDLGAKTPGTLDELIQRLYETDLAAHVPPSAFRWLNTRGFATWIFDGLDEFYRSQNDFFQALEQMLDAPGSRSQIIICTRDSLFSSSKRLIEFLERRLAQAPERTDLYELRRWDAAAKRAFVEVKLRADGVRDSALSRRADELMSAIEKSPNMAELTDLPFYCDLFVKALQGAAKNDLRDETELLQFAVDALIEREAGKLSIDWDVFVSDADIERTAALAAQADRHGLGATGRNMFADALREHGQQQLERLLGGAAHFYRFGADDGRSLAEISVEEWSEVLSPVYIDAHLDDETEERVKLALMQFAFFARGRGGSGQETMSFVHELIADFLAAKYAAWLIQENAGRPEAWSQALGRKPDISRTVFFRYLAEMLAEDRDLAAKGRAALESGKLAEPARTHLRQMLEKTRR